MLGVVGRVSRGYKELPLAQKVGVIFAFPLLVVLLVISIPWLILIEGFNGLCKLSGGYGR